MTQTQRESAFSEAYQHHLKTVDFPDSVGAQRAIADSGSVVCGELLSGVDPVVVMSGQDGSRAEGRVRFAAALTFLCPNLMRN
jgi:hypothetical protein